MSVSLQEAVEFIKSRPEFSEWTEEALAARITEAVRDIALTYTRDEHGKLNGICLGYWKSKQHFHVSIIIGKISNFINYLRSLFPECKTISGMRSGKYREYSITKF
jgi:hypothetical protein